MQNFQNTVDQSLWAFEDDVVATNTAGVYSFTSSTGLALNVPTTLIPYTAPTPTLVQLLEGAQSTQATILQNACAAAIVAGFTSLALGTANNYPSDVMTQANIALLASTGGYIWCANTSGNWAFTQHTAAQATQVLNDMSSYIQSQQSNYATLLTQIKAATTVAQVQAVTWTA
jgi:hypothetical protein